MTIHLRNVSFHPDRYPTREHYPFNLSIFRRSKDLEFDSPVTIFVGENGTGKSTLLEALSHKCGIHIWRNNQRLRLERNPYEDRFYEYITVKWTDGRVPGSFFGSSVFQDFAYSLDEWAAADRGQLNYFGGKSLVTQSHGQSIMSFFMARYRIKGLYLLDEPETALSPKSQIGFLNMLSKVSGNGRAQFIMATHSPIILSCPGATIYSFDHTPIKSISYEETAHYQLYRDFMTDRHRYLPDR
jgi:predicted ATPase